MKVVHVHWSLAFGGIETMLVNIANEQVKLGAEVTVVIINNSNEPSLVSQIDPRVKLVIFGRGVGSKGFGFVWKMNKVLSDIAPDVIHLHSSKLRCLLFKKELSRITLQTLHDLPRGIIRRDGVLPKIFPILNYGLPGNVTVLDLFPRVFAISQSVHDELLEKYGIDSHVICNGIMTSAFVPRKSGRPVGERMKIVMVSRLYHEKKGQDLLIRAAATLPHVEVDFIGDGASRDYLQQLIDKLNVNNRIRLLGKRDQSYIREHLCDYDLFAQPSRYEGFGLTVAEAMAAQVPVLVSAGQGPAEVTCNDKYGWVFENGNVKDLINIIKYIQNHPNAVAEKAIKARQYVINNYDVSITAKNYLNEYCKL